MTNGSLMEVKNIAACSKESMHLAIIGLQNQFEVFLRGFAVYFSYYAITVFKNG